MLEIVQIPVLRDNYIYLLHEPIEGVTAVVDPAEAAPVLDVLAQRGWHLDLILNTHHHGDHTGGNKVLKAKTGCTILGAATDAHRIPLLDVPLHDGAQVSLGATKGHVLFVPGHTSGHIAYHFPDAVALFCGDTLFSVGCGRLFEGTAEQMWHSLCRLRALPDETQVFCAHEYTASNIRFAQSILPTSQPLQALSTWVQTQRSAQKPTVPSTIGRERLANPFLQADSPLVQDALGMMGHPPAAVFGALRQRKDIFS